jgi:putative phosphoesterase
MEKEDQHIVGVISDTHGLLRPEVVEIFQNVNLIIHAGDIGREDVLTGLRKIAAVSAVRGNMDGGTWANALPVTEVVEIGETLIYVVHDLGGLDLDPASAGFRVVISGHSHMASTSKRDDVLYLNPGSAGPRRFGRPVSVAILTVGKGHIQARVVELKRR